MLSIDLHQIVTKEIIYQSRFDLGNLCYFQQYWTSDDTDARERVKIQDGTSYAYPQVTMGSHVSACPNHQTGNSNPLETRFNVACGGVLGYELDMSKFSEEELGVVAEQVAFYKQNRKLLQFGEYHRLGDAFGSALGGYMAVSKDRSQAIAVVAVNARVIGVAEPTVLFKGLLPSAVYEVTSRKQSNYEKDISFTAGGDMLMNGGYMLRGIFDDKEASANSGCIYTRMFMIKKCKN